MPEYRLSVREFDPALLRRGQAVAYWGEVLENRKQIARLRDLPWVEAKIYTADAKVVAVADDPLTAGLVKAGPQNKGGYVVSPATKGLKCQLYVLRLKGNTAAYLGHNCGGCSIYKIGLSVSPELRRNAFQDAMPRGAFQWVVARASKLEKVPCAFRFEAAVAGEYAMKRHLAAKGEHLGGEFYLATEADIDKAWRDGHVAARSFGRKS